jgi:hypothetical protein
MMSRLQLHVYQISAKILIAEHCGRGWCFKWHWGCSTYGLCDYGTLTISISKPLAAVGTMSEAQQSLAHEIAHALVPHEKGHGPLWAAMCERLHSAPASRYAERDLSAKAKIWVRKQRAKNRK